MSDHPNTPSPAEAASAWFARLRSPDCGAADRLEFERWLAADPRHRQEYQTLESLWQAMSPLQSVYAGPLSGKPTRRAIAKRFYPVGIAAALLLAVGLLWRNPYFGEHYQHYHTDIGERLGVTLADGSLLELNTATDVTVRYDTGRRELTLERGELFAQVAHQPWRPFVVKAAGGETRDIGTQFAVYRGPASTTVSVFEGEVEVRSGADAQALATTSLRGGEQLAYNASGRQSAPIAIDIEARQAWRRGEIIWRDQTLAQVAAEIERYHPVCIQLASPGLASQRISGVFKADDLNGIVSAIAALLDAEARRPSPGVVVFAENRQRL